MRTGQQQSGSISLQDFDRFLSQEEARSLFGVSLRTWQRLVTSGRVPKPDAKIGRMPRWRASTLKSVLENGGQL
jgi:predicted DNA-binding transcriptional regulator AlpA